MVSILERLDYQPLHVPAIEVERSVRSETLARIANLKDYTDIVFVSRNAVEIGMCLIDEVAAMPEHIRALTVGSETAKQLYRFGVDAMFPHQGTGAEALLAVKQLADLTDRKILIIRGQAGLDWPQEEMRRRGAQVDDAIVYSQKPPTESAAQLHAIFHDHESLAGVFAHSSQGVINLVEIAGDNAERLLKTKLVAGSQGIANAAIELGWQGEIKVAVSPANKHMMITFSGS